MFMFLLGKITKESYEQIIINRRGNTMHKILLVDDDYFVRKGLLRIIDWKGCGFEVCGESDNGEDAFSLIKQIRPDLVITDIRMPVLDGLDLIKATVESVNPVPNFVIISGHDDFKYAQLAVRYGVHDFLLKPIDKEEFEKTLMKVAEKIRKENVMRRNREKLAAQVALEDILQGKANKEAELEYRQRLNIESSEKVCYIILELNNIGYDISNLKDKISDAICLFTQHDMVLIREHGNNSFGLLVTDKLLSPFTIDIEEFLTRLRNQLSLNIEIHIYMGKLVTHIDDIHKSYETAIELSQFKYTLDRNGTIEFEKFKDKSVNYIELDHHLYNLLIERIEENDTESILIMIDRMFQNFKTRMFARDAVTASINRCVHGLIRSIKDLGGDENTLSTLHQMLSWDHYPLSLTKTKEIFTSFVLESSELILTLHSDTANGIIYKVKNHIERHFVENITLKEIANKFHMNPVYMGQLFKKTYGIYFKDFILQIRLNEAKKLLRQTDMLVYQIAENVGYNNSDYFVTQFEKRVSMTPTEYRNKILKKSV